MDCKDVYELIKFSAKYDHVYEIDKNRPGAGYYKKLSNDIGVLYVENHTLSAKIYWKNKDLADKCLDLYSKNS